MSEDSQLDYYKSTLEGSFSDLRCGEKTLWVVNSILSSKIVSEVIKITLERELTWSSKGHALSDTIITKKGDENSI